MVDFIIESPGEYRTRDGRKAVVLGRNPQGRCSCWIGYVGRHTVTWDDEGHHDAEEDQFDLLSEWTERNTAQGWIVIYREGHSAFFDTEIAARRNIGQGRFAEAVLRWHYDPENREANIEVFEPKNQ